MISPPQQPAPSSISAAAAASFRWSWRAGHRQQSIAAVEFQPRLAEIAARNIADNGLTERVTLLAADILELADHFPANSFDLVMGNPPYRQAGTGKTSPRSGRDLARHESSATLADFLLVAKKMVKPSGSICYIYHPERLAELLSRALELKLSPARLQMVHGGSVTSCQDVHD